MKIQKSLILIFTGILTGISVQAQDTLTLKDAVKIALANNYNILIARNNSIIADYNNTPGNAGMLPSLNAGISDFKYSVDTLKTGNKAQSNEAVGALSLNWTLFDGFNMFFNKGKLNELQNLSDIQLRSVIESTVSQVVLVYYGIIQQEKLTEVYHQALIISMERTKIARTKLEIGSGSELSYLQSRVDMNADSASFMQEKSKLINLKVELNRILCRDLLTPVEVNSTIVLKEDLILSDLQGKIDTQNPELLSAQSNLAVAEFNRKSSASVFYPHISLNSGYNYNKTVTQGGVSQANRYLGYNIGITASINIFDGFTMHNNYKIAKISEENTKNDLNQTGLEVNAQLQEIYTDYNTNLALVKFEAANLELASRNFNIASEKYRLGAISDIELRETQNKLIEAESRYLLAQYNAKTAETELLQMTGQLSESFN